MRKNNMRIAMGALSLLLALPAHAQERDPFMPYGAVADKAPVAVASPVEEGEGTPENLLNYPLNSFRLVGVMIAPDMKLAVMQGRDRKDYIITEGDKVGKENAVVEQVMRGGIKVSMGEQKLDIPVSNKVEKVNGKSEVKE